MNPEDIAAMLKQVGYKELVEVLAMTDPNLYQAIVIIEDVRKHGYGQVELHIVAGKITQVNQTIGHKITPV